MLIEKHLDGYIKKQTKCSTFLQFLTVKNSFYVK